MTERKITNQLNNSILKVTLNRPQARNALDDKMYEQICSALTQARNDPEIKGLLIQGAGDHFCAGNDLADFSRWPELAKQGKALPVTELIQQVVTFPKPLIASIQGATVGIGATLLAHCDIVIGARSARISYPFSSLGLIPEFASTLLLPELVGQARARQTLLLSETVEGERAYELGIISTLCDDAELASTTQAVCEKIGKLPFYSLLHSKQLIQSPERQQQILKRVEDETERFLECLNKTEHKAAIQQFFRH
jgi:enoyl-CoA hydratase/carnithine racemase